jgi:hypothetical protein
MLLSLILLTACQTIPKPDRATMAMGFAEGAYGLGIEPEGRHAVITRDKLLRWNRSKAVNLVILGEPAGSPLYKRIARDLLELYRQANVTLRLDFTTTNQLLRVTVSDDPLLVTKQIKTRCYTRFSKVDDGHLETVYIVAARSALSGDDEDCLLHEGMHSLGFSGHPHRLDSLLSYTHDQNALSDIDFQLIEMLYNYALSDGAPLDEALTFAYNQFSGFREQRAKRYIPLDISIEVTQDESPLVLQSPFMSTSSHQYYYMASKNGTRTINASYGLRNSGQTFAEVTHTILSRDRIFKKQYNLKEFVELYASYLGPITERSHGDVDHALGRFKYVIVDSPSFSCVFTIKFINASDIDIGGHEMLSGYYCDDSRNPLDHDNAAEFIQAIQVFDRDPVRLREQRMASRRYAGKYFLAIRLTGKWPLDDSYISGLKLIARGNIAGKMLIEISGETCSGQLTDIGTNDLGEWTITCTLNEDASGRFSWDADGTLSFRGETATTAREINWTGYQVF